MLGLELVAGYLAVWAMRKAGRVARRADAEVDQALDAALDRLHEAIEAKVGGEPALTQLEQEASDGVDQPRTRERVRLAVEDAADHDPAFATAVEQLVGEVRALLERAEATKAYEVDARGAQGVQVGDHNAQNNTFS